MSQLRVNINGLEIVTAPGKTILEVAKAHLIHIPTFCHNEQLKNYGSCGICVVEVEGNPRLLRACSTEIADGMVIKTSSERIQASRKTTLELMITDHEGDCKAPCTLGCPGRVDVQGYVGLIANGAYEEALKLIKEELPLPASIGRVCPHPCQTACRRSLFESPIHIAWLKRYVADLDLKSASPYVPAISPDTGKRIAIIGGGPSGLTCAYYLRQKGHAVSIFEAMPEFGGMLKYGIPLYRLPKEVLLAEVKLIESMGVTLRPSIRIGEDLTLAYLRSNYDAVYVSVGAWKSTLLDCPGQHLNGVHGGITFLNKFAINEPIQLGKKIAVIGGGNTAMDAARTSVRLGAEKVYAIYRRTKADMPAVDVEIEEAEEEGVDFKFLLNPIEIIGDENGNVKGLRLQKMKATKSESGRTHVVPIEGEEVVLDVDAVIVSIGQHINPVGLEALDFNEKGFVKADPTTFETNLEGVFAGGDCTNKGATIAIEAISEGKFAARVMHTYLEGEMKPHHFPYTVKRNNLTATDFPQVLSNPKPAAFMGHEAPELRVQNFEEVVHGYKVKDAHDESNRCLECGCQDVFECALYEEANVYDVSPDRFLGAKNTKPMDSTHPFIARDSNKCILCGQCVRICDEVMDRSALGLVNRGFDTTVLPALEKRLSETSCISCGQCVHVCPTGALQEKNKDIKPTPLRAHRVQTICHGCSVGCHVTMETKADKIIRALPTEKTPLNEALLCAKGRFGFMDFSKEGRIAAPMIRKNGVLVETTYQEALLFVARKAQSIQLVNGNDALSISVSDRLTNEEMVLVKQFGEKILNTNQIFSFNRYPSGLERITGIDASTNTLLELEATDCVLVIDTDLINSHTIAAVKLSKAAKQGVKVLTLNGDDLESTIKQIGKWLSLKAFESTQVSPDIQMLLETYQSAKKAMIVYDQNAISLEVQLILTSLAAATNHLGSPRNGIIQLKPNVNSQGLSDMGIKDCSVWEASKKHTKGLLLFGESIELESIEDMPFLMVMDTHWSELSKRADVVLPARTLYESDGTVTSMDKRIQRVKQVVSSPVALKNLQVITALMNTFSTNTNIHSVDEVTEWIHKNIPTYKGVRHLNGQAVYWPIGLSPVLHEKGFSKESHLAHLTFEGEPRRLKTMNTNVIMRDFEAFVQNFSR